MNYMVHENQLAYRAAGEALERGQITPGQYAQHVASTLQNPTADMMAESAKNAASMTLIERGNKFTQMLSGLTNYKFNLPVLGDTQLLKFIDPFVHISSNIINKTFVERTPLGILSPTIREELTGVHGTIAADVAAARMLAGTALVIGAGGLAAEGYFTGSGPSNPEDRALWNQIYQPHSVRIGDNWYQTTRLGPLGLLAGTAADLYDVVHTAERLGFDKATSALVHAVAQNVLDESFMRGPAELMKAIDDWDRYGDAYVRNMMASFVPFSVGMSYMARASDPYTRQARTLADEVRSKVPGLSEQLLPRIDVWGEPMPNKTALLTSGLTAIWEQRVNNDPVNKAMLALGMHQAMPERTIRNVRLTDQEYNDWATMKGRLTKLALDRIVRSPTFLNLPPEGKRDLIVHAQHEAGETARGAMFAKYRHILIDARNIKFAKRTAPEQ
jgi:hypothetical protein